MDQRSQDSIHDPAVTSMGFLLASYISELKLKEPTTWKRQEVQRKNLQTSIKCLLSLAKEPGKGAAYKDRNLVDNNHSILTKHSRKIHGFANSGSQDGEEARHPSL